MPTKSATFKSASGRVMIMSRRFPPRVGETILLRIHPGHFPHAWSDHVSYQGMDCKVLGSELEAGGGLTLIIKVLGDKK